MRLRLGGELVGVVAPGATGGWLLLVTGMAPLPRRAAGPLQRWT
jgi:hypothetical protein